MRNYKELLKNIRTLIFDYDGVFTDGIVIVTDEGELIRTANTKDGYAVQQAVKKGFHVAVITGGKNGSVKTRMNMLGVKHVYTHVENKAEKMMEVLAETDTKPEQVMYMGDDIPDMGPMKKVALACCPDDAVEEIKRISHYISDNKGGYGAVRDIIEQVLKAQNLWINE